MAWQSSAPVPNADYAYYPLYSAELLIDRDSIRSRGWNVRTTSKIPVHHISVHEWRTVTQNLPNLTLHAGTDKDSPTLGTARIHNWSEDEMSVFPMPDGRAATGGGYSAAGTQPYTTRIKKSRPSFWKTGRVLTAPTPSCPHGEDFMWMVGKGPSKAGAQFMEGFGRMEKMSTFVCLRAGTEEIVAVASEKRIRFLPVAGELGPQMRVLVLMTLLGMLLVRRQAAEVAAAS